GEKHLERSRGVRVEHDAVAADEGVVDEALHLNRAEADAAHVRVTWDVIEVVDRRGTAEDRLERVQPSWWCVAVDVRVGHHPRNPHRVDLLAGREMAGGTRAQRADDVGKLVGHEVAPDDLVVEMPLLEHLVVEEVPKWTVTDVVEETRNAEGLFDECGRGRIGKGNPQRGVDTSGEQTGKVHRTQQVCEA